MIDVQSCRQNAADCVRQAQGEDSAEDRDLLLNVALAWLRLAQQAQARETETPWDEQEAPWHDEQDDLPLQAELPPAGEPQAAEYAG